MTNGEKYISNLPCNKLIDKIGYWTLAGLLKNDIDSCDCCIYKYEDCGDCDCKDGIFSWLTKETDKGSD